MLVVIVHTIPTRVTRREKLGQYRDTSRAPAIKRILRGAEIVAMELLEATLGAMSSSSPIARGNINVVIFEKPVAVLVTLTCSL